MRILWSLFFASLISFNAHAVSENFTKSQKQLAELRTQLKPDTFQMYLQIHQTFFKQVCGAQVEATYYQKLDKFNGDGQFVPLLTDKSLDREAIILHIPILEQKINWIEGNIQKLKQTTTFEPLAKDIDELEKNIFSAQELKKKYFESLLKEEKESIQKESSEIVKKIQTIFEKFIVDAPFFSPFKYPVDHLQMRAEYDRFKFREDVLGNKFSNRLMFSRRIMEDGAPTYNKSRHDLFYRTLINTLHFTLGHPQTFLTENNRYDLSSFINISRNLIEYGIKEQINRMEGWKKREERKLEYYKLMLKNQIQQENGQTVTVKQYVEDKLKARDDLRKFVLQKYIESYEFWNKYLTIYQALFAMETILFNEVGTLDGPGAPERHDVLRVVKIRHGISFYSTLNDREPLMLLMQENKKTNLTTSTWMNLLFKEGEFSFTYYYMHGAPKVFCPDRTGLGEKLRRENVEIAMGILKEETQYQGVRYFSRASMVGRIDMSTVWSEFVALAEEAGTLIPNWRELWGIYQKGDYRFLYHFYDSQGKVFKVVEMRQRYYVIPLDGEGVYYYRDPNLFRYFAGR